jgi:hypothetical protein
VLDDAYHGHPEPSAAPPGTHRYALQLVYYTRAPPPSRLTEAGARAASGGVGGGAGGGAGGGGGRPRQYPEVHGAVFQPPCIDSAAVNMSYICSREWADKEHNGQLVCECNFRTT